jgi:amino acid transporter
MGALAAFGSATSFSVESLVPRLGVANLLFWSTIAFAWTGPEAASFMGGEIRDARRTVPRGLLLAAPMIAAIYVLGTASILVAVPAGAVSGLEGVLQAVQAAEARLGWSGVTALAAILVTITSLGSVGAWFETVARLPFVAGIDRFLPERFGRLHPRWGSPYVALLTQAAVTVVFVLIGQAGTTVGGAYQVLVSLTVVVTFIPFVLLFAAAVKLAGTSDGGQALRLPGGPAAVVAFALVGLATTLGSIVLSLVPPESEPNKPLAVAKVLGTTALVLGAGILVYARGRRAAGRVPP